MRVRKKTIQLSLMTSLLISVLVHQGCGYPDKVPSHFEKIAKQPNAFRMVVIQPNLLIHPREHIRAIKVYQRESYYSDNVKECWKIIANKPIDAEGFEIIVGIVPEGFRQVTPSPDDVFTTVPGVRYEIAVSIDHPLAMPWASTHWWAVR